MRKNESLPFATTQMDLESIMLGEISQTEKDKYCTASLIYGILYSFTYIWNQKTKQMNKHNNIETES